MATKFYDFVRFWAPFGMSFGMVFGCLGTLEIKLKCESCRQNHTLDFFFVGTDSRGAFVIDCFMILSIFNVFKGPFGKRVGSIVGGNGVRKKCRK